jgi:hypothetical protein
VAVVVVIVAAGAVIVVVMVLVLIVIVMVFVLIVIVVVMVLVLIVIVVVMMLMLVVIVMMLVIVVIRLRQVVLAEIAQDVLLVGMRNHAQLPAAVFLLPEDLAHAGVDPGDVPLHVGVPVGLLVEHLVLAQAHLVPEEGHHPRMKVLQEIVLQRAAVAGAVPGHVFLKAGEVDRSRAVDDGVVVVDDQATVLHRNLHWYRYV